MAETKIEIIDRYKQLHRDLSFTYYTGTSGLTKETFTVQHGQIWNDMEAELIAKGFLDPPEPRRDLGQEIDELKAKIDQIEKVSKG